MSPRKLYVDSRKRVSGSHSDFDYQLPNPIQVPKSRCFVDSVHLANVFPTITSHSRFIYIEEISTTNVSTKRKVGLTAGQNHDGTTLATEVALRSIQGQHWLLIRIRVHFHLALESWLSATQQHLLQISVRIWTADYLKHGLWNPLNLASIPAYIEGDDCYDVIGFASPYKITGNSTTPITGEGHISVMPYHTLFLHSDLGLQGDALGPDNSSSIVRKIVLETGPGTQVNDFHSLPYDFVSVQPPTDQESTF